jgi:endonuclease I
MKKTSLLISAFFAVPHFLFAQVCDLRFEKDTLDAGTVRAGETVQLIAKVINSGTENSELLSVKFTEDVFKADVSPAIIAPGESREIPISFKTSQNLDYTRAAFFRVSCGLNQYSIPLVLKVRTTYSDSLYNFTQNLSGEALKIALKNYVSGHTSLTYKDARTAMFSYIDNVNGEVECVYTGRKIATTGIPDVNTTQFNTEHTWPQSKGADDEPERSDLNHIFPTDEIANSRRASFPFGYVGTNEACWAVGGSKLQCSTKFETRDVHKGNVARAMLYFSVRYGNPFNYIAEQNQEIPLREWMKIDTVDARELARNNEIEKLQKRRNPFIDHPEFTERIYSFSSNGNFPVKAFPADTAVYIDVRSGESSVPAHIFLKGNGEATMVKTEIFTKSSLSDAYSVELPEAVLDENGFATFLVTAKDISKNNEEARIRITFQNGDTLSFVVRALQTATGVSEQNVFKTFTLQQNFPNPVEGATTIQFTAQPHKTALKLYTLQGEEILDATPMIAWHNESGSVTLQKEFLQQFGNIIGYRLITPDGTAGKFMIIQ